MLLLEHISTTAVVNHLRVKILSTIVADCQMAKRSWAMPTKPSGKEKV